MTLSCSENAVIVSPIGKLGIETQDESLIGIHFLSPETAIIKPSSLLAKEVERQLLAFFNKKISVFDLPLQFSGSIFQQTVLRRLCHIPIGSTLTYGDLGTELKTSPRAIGNACRHNLIPIVVPCHRVVAKQHIGGYSGAVDGNLLRIKKWLLRHEGHE